MMSKDLKIMIVEDEIITAIELEMHLRSAGYIVASRVTSGEKAVSNAEAERIDVVIMDIRLAGIIDGIEAAEKIQSIRETDIIFITGYEDQETRKRAEALNPTAFLLKPVDASDFSHILNHIAD